MHQILALLVIAIVAFANAATHTRTWQSKVRGKTVGTLTDAPVTTGICDPNVQQLSGYFKVKSGVDKNYFFWFFESRSKTAATDPGEPN